MNNIPENIKIYHLTHIENLQSIFNCGELLSDMRMQLLQIHTNIGISEIKKRRLEQLEVHCHTGTKVGEYVPFYFCPRSVMLYIIHKGNHRDITYTGGQNSIVYFQADLRRVVEWAEENARLWAFSDINAGARYASFFCNLAQLNRIDWDAVQATDFRDTLIKDRKQAEFLLYGSFPVTLIERIGVISNRTAESANKIIASAHHEILVEQKLEWYF